MIAAASLGFISFAHPALLAAGLVAIALPLLIHLLMRRRRRPVPFAAMRFLAEAMKRQRRRLKLQQWLLLAARCLLIALIGVAIARPMLSADGLATGPRTVVVLVDNSITAGVDAEGAGESDLAGHIEAARRVLESLDTSRGDRAGLIALAGPIDPVVFPPAGDVGGVAAALSRVTQRESRADVAAGVELAMTLLDDDPDATVELVLLTAGRSGSLALDRRLGEREGIEDRVSLRIVGVDAVGEGAASSPGNVAVTAVSPLRRVLLAAGADAGLGQVRVRLARFGEGVGAATVSRVTLTAAVGNSNEGNEPRVIGSAVVRWQPGQAEAEAAVTADFGSIEDGPPSVVLRASVDSDALAADNSRATLVRLRDTLRVGVVGSPGGGGAFTPADWVRLALAPSGDEPVRLETIRPGTIDAATLAGVDAVVLAAPDRVVGAEWSRLGAFVEGGGTLLITPAAREGVQRWPDLAAEAFGLGWRVEREPASRSDGAGGRGLVLAASSGELDELLALVNAELAGLLGPVRVDRWLTVSEPGVLRPVVSLDDGTAWMLVGRGVDAAGDEGRGVIVVLTSALDLAWTDLPAKPLIVPMLNEVLRQGVGLGGGDRERVAGESLSAPTGAVTLASGSGDVRRVGDDGRSIDEPIRTAGVWNARRGDGSPVATLVINPDVAGSATDRVAPERIEAWLAGGGITRVDLGTAEAEAASAGEADRGRFAAWLLAIAVGIALVELLLARMTSAPRSGTPSTAEVAA